MLILFYAQSNIFFPTFSHWVSTFYSILPFLSFPYFPLSSYLDQKKYLKVRPNHLLLRQPCEKIFGNCKPFSSICLGLLRAYPLNPLLPLYCPESGEALYSYCSDFHCREKVFQMKMLHMVHTVCYFGFYPMNPRPCI